MEVLPSYLWSGIQKMPRLRAENVLIKAIHRGVYYPESGYSSTLAADWIYLNAQHFFPQNKSRLEAAVRAKLRGSKSEQDFVAKYMLDILPDICQHESIINLHIEYICKCVEEGNEFMKAQLADFLTDLAPEEWEEKFKERLPSTDLS